MTHGLRTLLLIVGCALVAAAVPARADDDLPGRVGRIASVQGTLYHVPDDTAAGWVEIGLNYPVAQGDNLRVERDGRAEVDYGGGQFRLAGATNLHVSRLDDRQLALFIAAGRVIIRVRVLEPDDAVRVDTPATQVALTRPGLYRVDVTPDAPHTTVIVREGEAEIATPTGVVQVLPGQVAALTGVVDEQVDLHYGGSIDGFDAWSATRDRVYEAPRQHAYVSRQMIGQADLDAYGAWQTYPDYGAVWFPTSVAPEWAPYRYGHWTWLSGWGYTWVDDAPWGYAPFHYGRWAHIGGRWGWCPGTFVARPLWAPALVAWYGGDGFVHAGAHAGPVFGWVPLGWREPFVPWWSRCTDRCWTRYNRPHSVNVAERRGAAPTRFANWGVPGGITAVTSAALTGGKPVAINRVPVASSVAFTPSLLTRPPAIKPIAPVRPAVRAGDGVPPPASSLYQARVPMAPAPSASRAAAAPVAPAARGLPLPVPGASARYPARIEEGRSVVPPAPHIAPAEPVTPSPRVTVATPAPRVPVAAPAPRVPVATPAPRVPVATPTPRVPVATPAPRVPAVTPASRMPAIAPAPPPNAVAPAVIPRAVAPAGSAPRVVPAPPAPNPVAPIPVPAAERGTARIAPPNPRGPAERPN